MPPKTIDDWRSAFAEALTLAPPITTPAWLTALADTGVNSSGTAPAGAGAAAAPEEAFAQAFDMADEHLQQPGTAPAGAGAIQYTALRDEIAKMSRKGLQMLLDFLPANTTSAPTKQMMANVILGKLITMKEKNKMLEEDVKDLKKIIKKNKRLKEAVGTAPAGAGAGASSSSAGTAPAGAGADDLRFPFFMDTDGAKAVLWMPCSISVQDLIETAEYQEDSHLLGITINLTKNLTATSNSGEDHVAGPDCPRRARGRRRPSADMPVHRGPFCMPFVRPTARPHPTPQPPCIASG
jgi:hypothetical protein